MSWTRVQSCSHFASATSCAATFTTANVTTGNKYVVAVTCYEPVTSVKNGAGTSLTQLASEPSGVDITTYLYALDVPSGDGGTKPTITVQCSGSAAGIGLVVQEVSGLLAGNTSAMLDSTAGVNTGATSGNTTSPSYSSGAASEYLVGVYGTDGTSSPDTAATASGYSADANDISLNGSIDNYIFYKNSTSGSESLVVASNSSGTGGVTYCQILVAFKLAAAGPAFTAPPNRPRRQVASRTPAGLIYA